ncbi:MAG: hypothetical protein AAF806_33005, partial [Bacteroidota bacterium]
LVYFQDRSRLGKELYEANPKSEKLKNGLAISYGKLGDLYVELGNMDKVLEYVQKTITIFKELYESNPKNEETKNNLSISYSRLGEINQTKGQLDSALFYFQMYVQLKEELYQNNPKNMDIYFGLGVSYYRMGSLLKEMTQNKSAITYYEQAAVVFYQVYEMTKINKYLSFAKSMLDESESLKEGDNSNPLLNKVTALQQKVNETKIYSEKVNYQREVVATFEKLLAQNTAYSENTASAYGNLSWYLLFVKDFKEAEKAARKGLTLDDTATWINTNLATALLFQGKYKAAKVIYEQLKDQPYEFDESQTYRNIFLDDLKTLEMEGVTHKDIKKVQQLLGDE